MSEKDLQRSVVAYLRGLGYAPMTESTGVCLMADKSAVNGVYGHLSSPQRNAMLPDLVIIRHNRSALMLELKDGQRAVMSRAQAGYYLAGYWECAASFDDAVAIITRYHNGQSHRLVDNLREGDVKRFRVR